MTQTLEDVTTDTELFPYDTIDDPNKRAHMVCAPDNPHLKVEGGRAQDLVDLARITGQEVIAYCGYRWIPRHDPEKLLVCGKCIDVYSRMGPEDFR